MSQKAQVLRSESLSDADAKWICLQRLVYRDGHGKERLWECANRKTRTGACDAALIVPILRTPTERHLVLVRQFRPPVGKICVEFPAGLLDPSESAEQTAIRELKEETGFVGRVVRASPVVHSDPDSGEDIEVVTIPLNNLSKVLQGYIDADMAVDARLQMFADVIALLGSSDNMLSMTQ
ncbi:NUDIX hydrolase domain-like protein [Syncephalis plumigaleata]|nr:NUDIX hydrolase domain-like protein [Syncephalis plumigaleata]